MTKFLRLSRFGMTFAPLTESHGEELLTSYLAGFPVKTSAQQDTAQASPAVDQDSGLKWQGLLGKYDHVTRSWKTAQCSLLADLEQCLEIWPRWGLMRDGVSYQQQTLVRHTSENESGLLPTPTCNMISGGGNHNSPSVLAGKHGLNLSGAVAMWPTPTAQDAKNNGGGVADGSQHETAKRGSGWPLEPAICRVVNGVAARVDRLKAIGNGQVPRVAATAFRLLSKNL
jgi:hypothetical protein